MALMTNASQTLVAFANYADDKRAGAQHYMQPCNNPGRRLCDHSLHAEGISSEAEKEACGCSQ
jgi:hypothetical protein